MTTAGGRDDGDVAVVAAAMVRYALPVLAAGGVRLEAGRDTAGTRVRLVLPRDADRPDARGDAGELMLIDGVADRWGYCGGTGVPSALWVLLR